MKQRGYRTIRKALGSMLFLTILCCCCMACCAQDSLMTRLDLYRYPLRWNADQFRDESTLALYHRSYAGSIGIAYQNEEGSLRRPQDPSSISLLSFLASGCQQTSGLIVLGKFQYNVQRDEGQQWRNTGHTADDQPFIWADTSEGIWDRNRFDAQVKMVTTRKDHLLQGGMELQYKGGTGDRQSTPKPLYRFHQLAISPSLVYKTEAHAVAVMFHYRQQSEDNEMGYYVYDSPLLYRLRGYGTFSRTPFVSGARLLKATTLGGSLEYVKGNFGGNYVQALASYDRTKGAIEEGVAMTTPAGDWHTHELSGKFNWGHLQHESQWLTSVNFSLSRVTGTDPIFQAVNYYLNKFLINPAIRYTRSDRWHAEIHAEYSTREQKDIVSVTNASVRRTGLGLSYYHRFTVSEKADLFTIPCLDYFKTLDSDLQVLSPTEISQSLVRADFNILSQSYQQACIKAGIDIKQTNNNNIRLAISVTYLQNADYNRTLVGASFNYFLL